MSCLDDYWMPSNFNHSECRKALEQRLSNIERQKNVGAKVGLDLVGTYKSSGRNVTTDNFFTFLELAETLRSQNLTLLGTVRRNKTFLPPNMQPSKDRPLNSTNFAFRKRATLCSCAEEEEKGSNPEKLKN